MKTVKEELIESLEPFEIDGRTYIGPTFAGFVMTLACLLCAVCIGASGDPDIKAKEVLAMLRPGGDIKQNAMLLGTLDEMLLAVTQEEAEGDRWLHEDYLRDKWNQVIASNLTELLRRKGKKTE